MNAAAKLVQQQTLSNHLAWLHKLTKCQLAIMTLTFSILFSMLSIIYVTHANRIMYADYEKRVIEYNRLQAEHSQLLLEHSVQLVPARIQETAENKLNMVLPDENEIVMVRE